jgi:hypothetical protein
MENYNLILANYLELKDDQYSLNISTEIVEKIGIPIQLLNAAKAEITKTNEFILKAKAEPNHELVLTDPKALFATAPTGQLTTNGQEEAQSGFVWAPYNIRGIRFTCRTNAALTPVYTCKTYSSGLWQARTAVGSLFTNTIVDVPLYVSNDYIRVAFSTTDSNGGSATFEGHM